MVAYTVGWPELVIILIVLLLLFGAKRLPEIARSMGKSTKEFKKGLQGESGEEHEAEDETEDETASSD